LRLLKQRNTEQVDQNPSAKTKGGAMKRRGLSLVEILVVIAIIAVLAGLLMPVLSGAKVKSKQAVCAANLSQAMIALNLYIEDQGEYPLTIFQKRPIRSTSAITSYSKSPSKVFLCPLDRIEGRGGRPLQDRLEPRSYAETWFLWEGVSGIASWARLTSLDSNPILFRCYFHDDRLRSLLVSDKHLSSFGVNENGLGLVARADGSVKLDRRSDIFYLGLSGRIPDLKKTFWSIASELACPSDVCDGKPLTDPVREF
jgi:prepilin-type N-terminal cleavage/methylation domain-containing protein